jgi:hypothetical protein
MTELSLCTFQDAGVPHPAGVVRTRSRGPRSGRIDQVPKGFDMPGFFHRMWTTSALLAQMRQSRGPSEMGLQLLGA